MKTYIKDINTNALSPDNINTWDEILEFSNGTIYHSKEWIFLQSQYSNLETRILFAYHNSNPVGLFPFFVRKKRGFIKHLTIAPFETPYGGPIVKKDLTNKEKFKVYDQLLNHFNLLSASTYSIDSVIDFPENILLDNKYLTTSKFSSVLNLLGGQEKLFKKMRRNHKRQLRKAQKADMEIIYDIDFVHLNEYYELLIDTYSRLQSKNLVDLDFYKLSIETIPKDRIHLFLIKHDNLFISGGLVLSYLDTVVFWRGATKSNSMKSGASNLLYWEIIKWASENKYKFLDTLHNPNESLEHFKRGFGCEKKVSWKASRQSKLWSTFKLLQNSLRIK